MGKQMVFRTACHPNAYGRVSDESETEWTVFFDLETGVRLTVSMGKKGWEAFRKDILKDDVHLAMDGANREMSK